MIFPSVAGYVLAGGESSRMQRPDLPSDKALLPLGGQTLLERALATLAQICPAPHILCGSVERCERLRHMGATVADRELLAGPLGGLDAALDHAHRRGAAWVIVMPVDLPWMSAVVLSALLQRAQASGAAVACMREKGIAQPLPLVLATTTGPALAAALQSGERKLMPVLRTAAESRGREASLFLLDVEELPATIPMLDRCFWNVNTPEDFEAAQVDETLRSDLHQSKHVG